MCTSTSNLDFNLSLNPNNLIIRIISNAFVSCLKHLYHSQYISFIIPNLVYPSQSFYIFNQIISRTMYLSSGLSITGVTTCHLVNALMFIVDKTNVDIKEKS